MNNYNKYCEDCKWFERNIFIFKNLRKCEHPNSNSNQKVIKNEKQYASIERQFGGNCGPLGNNSEPK